MALRTSENLCRYSCTGPACFVVRTRLPRSTPTGSCESSWYASSYSEKSHIYHCHSRNHLRVQA